MINVIKIVVWNVTLCITHWRHKVPDMNLAWWLRGIRISVNANLLVDLLLWCEENVYHTILWPTWSGPKRERPYTKKKTILTGVYIFFQHPDMCWDPVVSGGEPQRARAWPRWPLELLAHCLPTCPCLHRWINYDLTFVYLFPFILVIIFTILDNRFHYYKDIFVLLLKFTRVYSAKLCIFISLK